MGSGTLSYFYKNSLISKNSIPHIFLSMIIPDGSVALQQLEELSLHRAGSPFSIVMPMPF